MSISPLEIVITLVLQGAVSAIATVIVLKTDLHWIKEQQKDHEKRLRNLEYK